MLDGGIFHIVLRWFWRSLIYIFLGSLAWLIVAYTYDYNICGTQLSFILAELISACTAGLFSSYIYDKTLVTAEIYKIKELPTLPSPAFAGGGASFAINSGERGVELIVFGIPFAIFAFFFAFEKTLIFSRHELVVSLIIGLWVSLGFSSVFINKIVFILTGNKSDEQRLT